MSTPAEIVNLPLNDSIKISITSITDIDGNTVTDLTGWKLLFTVKPTQTTIVDTTAIYKANTANWTILAGQATLIFKSATTTTAMVVGTTYYGDVKLVDASGRNAIVKSYDFLITPAITIRNVAP